MKSKSTCSAEWLFSEKYYLCRGGCVLSAVCLSVCQQNYTTELIFLQLVGEMGSGLRKNHLIQKQLCIKVQIQIFKMSSFNAEMGGFSGPFSVSLK